MTAFLELEEVRSTTITLILNLLKLDLFNSLLSSHRELKLSYHTIGNMD